MADSKTTRGRKPAELKIGERVSVRITKGLYDDLTVMMRTGCDASDALRYACSLVASVFEQAWEQGHYPPGVSPDITSMNMNPYRPVRQADQAV